MLFENEADAAFAGLAVHPHRLFVGGAHIGRIDWQIGHFPVISVHVRHAFADGILMRSGKRREHQISRIGMAFGNRQLVDVLGTLRIRGMSRKSSCGIDALAEHVHRHGTMSQLPVRSPLPNSVPSTRFAPAISASSVAAMPVPRSLWVCRLMTCARAREIATEPLDLIGIDVGRAISTVDGRLMMIGSSPSPPRCRRPRRRYRRRNRARCR